MTSRANLSPAALASVMVISAIRICKMKIEQPGAVGAERKPSNSGVNEGTKVSGMATGDMC